MIERSDSDSVETLVNFTLFFHTTYRARERNVAWVSDQQVKVSNEIDLLDKHVTHNRSAKKKVI